MSVICTRLSQARGTVRQASSLDLKLCASKLCSKSGPFCTDRIIESPNLGVLQDVQEEELQNKRDMCKMRQCNCSSMFSSKNGVLHSKRPCRWQLGIWHHLKEFYNSAGDHRVIFRFHDSGRKGRSFHVFCGHGWTNKLLLKIRSMCVWG